MMIDPSQIESELIRIWEGLAKENKMRACLFNLIVYNQRSPRTDYVRSIVQKVIEKFPCRILFISHEPKSAENSLKTAVSVIAPNDPESTIACDHIDISVQGTDLEQVPFLLLPHIIPDLPVYLLWTEDPCNAESATKLRSRQLDSEASPKNSFFSSLAKLCDRIIFDSESAENLFDFAKTLLNLSKLGIDIADLNWARIEGWRNLTTSLFHSEERLKELRQLDFLQITYNAKKSESFCHLKVQAMYFLSWLANRLDWKIEKLDEHLAFRFHTKNRHLEGSIQSTLWEPLTPGTIVSVEMKTADGHLFQCLRLPQQYHRVGIQISTPEKCDLPFQFMLGPNVTGQSLVSEITKKGTSSHYIGMLEKFIELEKLC